jgi:HEPN domain-containing protein
MRYLTFSIEQHKLHAIIASMDVKHVVFTWREGANQKWVAARHAFQTRDYPESLFWGHLYIEKLLKALVVQRTGKHALPIHKLTQLAQEAKLDLTPELEKLFVEITTFNTETRYTEEKAELRTKFTREYSQKWLREIGKVGKWLESQFT